MNPTGRRRKKRPNYGIRTVEVARGPSGFGFTISGQQPCILSCIVAASPADAAGLRAGDFLISVNGVSVSKMAHDSIVGLIGGCPGPIAMTVADNYYSDSSDEELECGRIVNSRKPKYTHKPRPRVKTDLRRTAVESNEKNYFKMREKGGKGNSPEEPPTVSNPISMEDESSPIEYKALVGYLGTIEMPKELLPSSRLQTVCSCIRKLRQEKRRATAVLMTVLPTCLTLKDASGHIMAIYPTNRVVYIGSVTDRESRYFGLVTSAVRGDYNDDDGDSKKDEGNGGVVEISNSCHVFVTDPKIVDHDVHQKKAEKFKVACTTDPVTGNCLEFPHSSLYIVSLVQSLYKLQNNERGNDNAAGPLVANSPQPSASSNSDSGIGYRDDCGNISDRILVVEFPSPNPVPFLRTNNRPSGIDASNVSLDELDVPFGKRQKNNLNNIRACEAISTDKVGVRQHNNLDSVDDYGKLNCRALPHLNIKSGRACGSESSDDNTKSLDLEPTSSSSYRERGVDVIIVNTDRRSPHESKSSIDNVSVYSSRSAELVFKVPFAHKRHRRHNAKQHSSCDNLSDGYKLSPKVYGSGELVNFDSEKYGFGSLRDLTGWDERTRYGRNVAQSEPDVRNVAGGGRELSEQNGVVVKYGGSEGPAAWACSFEKLLDDPVGLQVFAEFLKKEFSAENIYFWTACERFRHLPNGPERTTEARRIYHQHLSSGAPEAVNIDAQGRQCTEQHLQDPSPNIFDQAQKQIFNLMKFDSYPRFLKSDIYRRCLSGELDRPSSDPRLSVHRNGNGSSTPSSKLKKSVSNAEDRRRKSLLPWHRKNRSKSKDRGESEYSHGEGKIVEKKDDSSGSSLTSLDLASSQDSTKPLLSKKEDPALKNDRAALCRVLLSNGSTTVVQIKESETIQDLIKRVLDKRGLNYSCFEVFTDKHLKALDVSEPSTKLAGCEVNVEQRVVFKVDLPNRKTINIKSKASKIIVDVLRPSLHKYHFNLDQVNVLNEAKSVDLQQPVTAINGLRLNVQLKEILKPEDSSYSVRAKVNRLDELTNKVFEGILQEKANSNVFKTPKSDKGSVKSEDWGSEHSSTFIGKFLRRDSGIHDKKKKVLSKCKVGNEEGASNLTKKPLIAKWKAGANKLNISSIENDELVEGLTRAQRRLEDQRGTEINFELPDFLKNKENQQQTAHLHRKPSGGDDRPAKSSTYENRDVTSAPSSSSIDSPSGRGASAPAPAEGPPRDGTRCSDPPPLPPKPKIVPIKPTNWGQLNGYNKLKATDRNQAMFLEQPSSSFV